MKPSEKQEYSQVAMDLGQQSSRKRERPRIPSAIPPAHSPNPVEFAHRAPSEDTAHQSYHMQFCIVPRRSAEADAADPSHQTIVHAQAQSNHPPDTLMPVIRVRPL
jgi:hypothetical protein